MLILKNTSDLNYKGRGTFPCTLPTPSRFLLNSFTNSKVQGFKEITKAEVLCLQGNHSKRHTWAHDFKTKQLFCHTQMYYQKYFAEVYLETSVSNT